MQPPEINELTRYSISVDFTDEDGAPVVPGSFTWRVQNAMTGLDIISASSVAPDSASCEIIIPASANSCASGKTELRRVTIIVPGLLADEYIYKIKKLPGV